MKLKLGNFLRHWQLVLICVTIIVAALAVIALVRAWRQTDFETTGLSVDSTKNIDLTPAQIQSIKNIGKWEFLSMDCEEMVDTVHKRLLLSDEELVRIYRGTIRLGVDLDKTRENWISTHGDTVEVVLPPIQSLNSDFIDEANAKTFSESGSWDAKARETLYNKAKRQMLKRMMQSDARQLAEKNGRTQMTALFSALGFKTVEVSYER